MLLHPVAGCASVLLSRLPHSRPAGSSDRETDALGFAPGAADTMRLWPAHSLSWALKQQACRRLVSVDTISPIRRYLVARPAAFRKSRRRVSHPELNC